MNDYRGIFADGLWNNNVVFAQMLALCPLMAVTTTATNGLGMGLATTGVLLASNVVIAILRDFGGSGGANSGVRAIDRILGDFGRHGDQRLVA